MSRILWLGNPPGVASGYGEQASLFVPRLMALGHELAVQCNWGLQGMRIDAGITYYPSDGQWGNTALGTYADDFHADHVIALSDAWVLHPDQWPDGIRVAVWAPVDHDPIPPRTLAVLASEKVQPIAMSRFGERQMADHGLDPLYVPHAVDRSVFYPRPQDRDATRAELGIPANAFLVGVVAANTSSPLKHRKAFDRLVPAFARFAAQHPDAWLYMHTQPDPPPGTGVQLDPLILTSGCPPGRVTFPPASLWHLGFPAWAIANLYQAFDVLMSPSRGEGFGIPLLEAQACGIPVIASDHSAMTELTEAGWLVEGDPDWDDQQEAYYIDPHVDSIVAALDAAYEARDDEGLCDRASAFADLYDADLVTRDYWVPALEQLDRPREIAPLAEVAA